MLYLMDPKIDIKLKEISNKKTQKLSTNFFA